jgi:hypothetical protein
MSPKKANESKYIPGHRRIKTLKKKEIFKASRGKDRFISKDQQLDEQITSQQ